MGIREKHYVYVLDAWYRRKDDYIHKHVPFYTPEYQDAFRQFMEDYITLKKIHDDTAIAGPGLSHGP